MAADNTDAFKTGTPNTGDPKTGDAKTGGGKKDGRDSSARAAGAGAAWQMVSPAVLVYRGDGRDRSQDWLLTFTDLSALMLTFFVLLFSMSTIKTTEWQNLVDALNPNLQSVQEIVVALPQAPKAAEAVERAPGTDLGYLAAVLKEQVEADAQLNQVRVTHDGERLVISVPGDLLFAPGSIELGEAGGKAAFALGGVLRNLRNVIEIAGHADPQQIGAGYASNWELSLARAAVLSGMLSEVGYRGEILVRGYGAARYGEVDPTLPDEARMARARRVDIIVHAYAAEAR
ncbi:flagellar motor protein MotB [Pelagibius sp. 7325]|uniref:OmpA/MotB family protein n=1 Tax=Pelagibius sp. 7325 TaxID=3131994 RepID=UPI0030EDD6FB